MKNLLACCCDSLVDICFAAKVYKVTIVVNRLLAGFKVII